MSVDAKEFRLALSHFTSGVTVVTTVARGKAYGMTVASFASLSLDPPLVLVCLEKGVQTHDAILESKHFAVSILRAGQQDVSNRFASRLENRFEGIAVKQGELGAPLIEESLAALECTLVDALPGGDHTIFVGRVEKTVVDVAAHPLVYFRSGYHELGR